MKITTLFAFAVFAALSFAPITSFGTAKPRLKTKDEKPNALALIQKRDSLTAELNRLLRLPVGNLKDLEIAARKARFDHLRVRRDRASEEVRILKDKVFRDAMKVETRALEDERRKFNAHYRDLDRTPTETEYAKFRKTERNLKDRIACIQRELDQRDSLRLPVFERNSIDETAREEALLPADPLPEEPVVQEDPSVAVRRALGQLSPYSEENQALMDKMNDRQQIKYVKNLTRLTHEATAPYNHLLKSADRKLVNNVLAEQSMYLELLK